MKNPVYVEICAGLGGTRAGLAQAGWECALAIDNDKQTATAHRFAFGDCDHADARNLVVEDIPSHDVLVAGFPCQPFSSSGLRTGFLHSKGNVFEAVVNVCTHHSPAAVLLENVRGILSNAYGHTFASVLAALTAIDYHVAWAVIDAAYFGVPQSRPRVFIVASRNVKVHEVLRAHVRPVGEPSAISLADILALREPRVGLRRPTPVTPFGSFGVASPGMCSTWEKVTQPQYDMLSALGEIVCPNFRHRSRVRSVRYWGHSGVTKPYFKAEAVAHCLGTNIGAGPTFGVERKYVSNKSSRAALLENANWVRDEEDHVVFRLTPARAALLFGPFVEAIQGALVAESCGITKQYEMLGNMVSPEVARRLGVSVRDVLF